MDLPSTRKIIDEILAGNLDEGATTVMPVFNLEIPTAVAGVDSQILDPRNTWENKPEYDKTVNILAQKFANNFEKYENTAEGQQIAKEAGPKL